jgi:hypothetical protein
MVVPGIPKRNLKSYDVPFDDAQSMLRNGAPFAGRLRESATTDGWSW